jgi:tRNA pseudouridine38-40 synthase
MRFAAGVEYDGAEFFGWQRQRHGATVQEAVERALGKVAAAPVEVVCAGRTDTRVHATQQVIHFDTDAERPLRAWRMGTNSNLPESVRLHWVQPVPEDFHARFGAVARAYRYVMASMPVRPALHRRRVSWTYRELDAERMQVASRCLIGEHDFSSYRAVGCQAKHPTRTIHRLEISRHGNYLYLDIEANAFLHHMVRNIAGVLMAIGTGERPLEWAAEVLAAKDRAQGGITAPPDGLYLVKVVYPEPFGIPSQGELPVFA